MVITKFGHSCILVEEGSARILIDPGDKSSGHTDIDDLDAVCITHEHGDHCDIPSLQAILARNPSAGIYTNAGVGKKLEDAGISFQILEDGQSAIVEGAIIEAYGKDHALIYETIPMIRNTGYFIAGRFFYPGDTVMTVPSKQIEILALPIVAPWLKLSEALDYARKINPKICFPVHDGIAKPGTFEKHPKNILPQFGIDVVILENGKPTEF